MMELLDKQHKIDSCLQNQGLYSSLRMRAERVKQQQEDNSAAALPRCRPASRAARRLSSTLALWLPDRLLREIFAHETGIPGFSLDYRDCW